VSGIRVGPAAANLESGMQRQWVESTVIAAAGYDAGTQTLEIEFRSGAVYRYQPVPANLVREMGRSGSIGSFFGRHIRNRFVGKRVDDQQAA
jgi:hypothetical protein